MKIPIARKVSESLPATHSNQSSSIDASSASPPPYAIDFADKPLHRATADSNTHTSIITTVESPANQSVIQRMPKKDDDVKDIDLKNIELSKSTVGLHTTKNSYIDVMHTEQKGFLTEMKQRLRDYIWDSDSPDFEKRIQATKKAVDNLSTDEMDRLFNEIGFQPEDKEQLSMKEMIRPNVSFQLKGEDSGIADLKTLLNQYREKFGFQETYQQHDEEVFSGMPTSPDDVQTSVTETLKKEDKESPKKGLENQSTIIIKLLPKLLSIDWESEIRDELQAQVQPQPNAINLDDYDLAKTAKLIERSLIQGKIWADSDTCPKANSKNNIKGAWFKLVPKAQAGASEALPSYYVIAKKVLRAEQIKWKGDT